MTPQRLFADPIVRAPAGVRLILGDATEAIGIAREEGGARLVIADPPWGEYSSAAGGTGSAAPGQNYPVLSLADIADHLDDTGRGSERDARLLVWHCWPLLVEMIGEVASEDSARIPARVLSPLGWRPVSGGAWTKAPHQGVGMHWLGRSEPVIAYVRGTPPTDRGADLGNAHVSEPGQHSAKPEAWTEAMIRRWTEPGDLVLDLYAGMGGVARACVRSGRRYVGAEIDPERHKQALGWIASGRVLA